MQLHFAGRHAEASEAIRQCLVLAPQRAGCNRSLAAPELALGHNEVAFDALRLAGQLTEAPATLAFVAYGYGLLGQPEDAQRASESLRVLAVDEHVDSVMLAMAYMGVGDYDEALIQLHAAAENPELSQRGGFARLIKRNVFSDPMLEEPDFAEVREKLVALTE